MILSGGQAERKAAGRVSFWAEKLAREEIVKQPLPSADLLLLMTARLQTAFAL